MAHTKGFSMVASSPLARSSYHGVTTNFVELESMYSKNKSVLMLRILLLERQELTLLIILATIFSYALQNSLSNGLKRLFTEGRWILG